MRTDVHETKDATIFDIEIPGYKKEEISVSLNGRNLVVSAKTSSKKDEKDGERFLYQERNSSCSRMFTLPAKTKAEDVSAKYENGVLVVTVKKAVEEEKEPDQIEIE